MGTLTEEQIGTKLKAIRDKLDLSGDELADIAGIGRPQISRIENNKVIPHRSTVKKLSEALKKRARELNIDIDIDGLLGLTQSKEKEEEKLDNVVVGEVFTPERISLVRIPVLGSIPAGYPMLQEQERAGFVLLPRTEIPNGLDTTKLYVLRITGNSLLGDGIEDGDLALVQSEPQYINDKIYVVRLMETNEVVARHVIWRNDHVVLYSSASGYKEIKATDVEIQGKIIKSGKPWKSHF